jgi:hypothetical protein
VRSVEVGGDCLPMPQGRNGGRWSARIGEEQRFTSERFNTLLSVVTLLGSPWMTHGRRKLSLSGASCLSAGGERCMALSSG